MEHEPEEAMSKTDGAGQDTPDHLRISDRRFWVRDKDGESPEQETTSRLPTFVEQLQQRLKENEHRLNEFREATQQEHLALRERLQRETEQQLNLAKGDFIKPFIDIVDNLDRALAAAQEQQTFEALLEGVQAIRQQMLQQLTESGVERLETVGQPFDPTVAEAVHLQAVDEAEQDGVVLAEFEVGYRYGETILRPAKVQVGKYHADG